MKGRLVRTPRAIRDLAEIISYIAADNPFAADRVADQLEARSRMLAASPGLGRPHIRPGTRVYPSGNYLILYRETSRGITILRYYHGRRDPRRI